MTTRNSVSPHAPTTRQISDLTAARVQELAATLVQINAELSNHGASCSPQIHRLPRAVFDQLGGNERHYHRNEKCGEFWARTLRVGRHEVSLFTDEPPLPVQDVEEPQEVPA